MSLSMLAPRKSIDLPIILYEPSPSSSNPATASSSQAEEHAPVSSIPAQSSATSAQETTRPSPGQEPSSTASMATSNPLFPSHDAPSSVFSSVFPGHISNLSDAHDGKCPLCVQAFHVREPVKKLICQHTFHPLCIDRWLETSILCPVCENQVIFPLAQVVDEDFGKMGSSSDEETADYHNQQATCRDCHRRFHRDPRLVRPDTSAYYRCPHCRELDVFEMIRASCVLL